MAAGWMGCTLAGAEDSTPPPTSIADRAAPAAFFP